jgi:tellurite resistance protein TerC
VAGAIRWRVGPAPALAFLTCYILELTLSVDNVAVMIAVFRYFQIPQGSQGRVLFWGVAGAIVMRAVFVFAGTALLARAEWVSYLFAALLVVTGIQMAFVSNHGFRGDSAVIRMVRRVLPVTEDISSGRFWVREGGRRVVTPLLLALIVIELGDIIFAVDSVPAAFAVTRDPWLVYGANIGAVIGLRSLYMVLAGLVERVRFLDQGLAVILTYVGIMMALPPGRALPTWATLAVVVGVLVVTALVSAAWPATPRD